jgi:acetyl-CoA C-acetyltransferase
MKPRIQRQPPVRFGHAGDHFGGSGHSAGRLRHGDRRRDRSHEPRGVYAPTARWGQKLGDTVLLDALNGALTDPFGKVLMGITAENVAERYGITREMQDALAVESQQRAAAAQAAGHFKDQIVPVEVKARGGKRLFDTDEHLRPDTTLESLATLKPVFRRDGEPLLPGMPGHQ